MNCPKCGMKDYYQGLLGKGECSNSNCEFGLKVAPTERKEELKKMMDDLKEMILSKNIKIIPGVEKYVSPDKMIQPWTLTRAKASTYTNIPTTTTNILIWEPQAHYSIDNEVISKIACSKEYMCFERGCPTCFGGSYDDRDCCILKNRFGETDEENYYAEYTQGCRILTRNIKFELISQSDMIYYFTEIGCDNDGNEDDSVIYDMFEFYKGEDEIANFSFLRNEQKDDDVRWNNVKDEE